MSDGYKSQRRAAILSAGEVGVAAPPVRSVGHPIVTVLPAGFGDDPPSEIMKPNVAAVWGKKVQMCRLLLELNLST